MNVKRAKRWAAIFVSGGIGGALVTLAAAACFAGGAATKQQMYLTAIAAESAVWPVAARLFRLISPRATRRERAVWRALIDEYARPGTNRPRAIAVDSIAEWNGRHREEPPELYKRLVTGWRNQPGFPEAAPAVHDFLIRNSRPTVVRCSLPDGSRMVTRTEIGKYRGDDAWERFSAEYRVDGYLSLSRVGFNVLGNRAVVYASFGCGGMCGRGTYYVLAKRGGSWIIIGEYVRWLA